MGKTWSRNICLGKRHDGVTKVDISSALRGRWTASGAKQRLATTNWDMADGQMHNVGKDMVKVKDWKSGARTLMSRNGRKVCSLHFIGIRAT